MNEDILNCLKDYCIEFVDKMKEAYGESEKYKDLLAEGYALVNDLANLPAIRNVSFDGYMKLFDSASTLLLKNFLFHKAKEFKIV